MKPLRFALFGAGFWSDFQLAGWRELEGVSCVAVCDPNRSKAEALSQKHGSPTVYQDAGQLLANEQLDFVDIVTDVNSHAMLARLAADHGLPAICQKPLAPSLEAAKEMAAYADVASTALYVHENWRWQAPLRRVKEIIDSGQLGTIVRARIDFSSSFPVFENQPFLKQLSQFILTDVGTHILDASRFLFGEASDLCCHTRQTRSDITGEDVATVMLRTRDEITVTCNMGYASRWEFDKFPQTFIAIEGTKAGASLVGDYEIRIFDGQGTQSEQVNVPTHDWADPQYALIHSSIVECHRNLLGAIRGDGEAETTVADNIKTLELVYGAYASAARNTSVSFSI